MFIYVLVPIVRFNSKLFMPTILNLFGFSYSGNIFLEIKTSKIHKFNYGIKLNRKSLYTKMFTWIGIFFRGW